MEGMSEYFGKRGMSVCVEVFITNINGVFEKQTYLVAFDRCDQNAADTLSIAELVINEFHKDFPEVRYFKIKSDNAGNFHCNGVFDCMQQIANKYNTSVTAYDYNEAQHVSYIVADHTLPILFSVLNNIA